MRKPDVRGGAEFTEDQIFDALVDAQIAGVDPALLRAKQDVYATGAGAQEPYVSAGVSADAMRFDLEVWGPRINELRENGALLSVTETRLHAQRLVGSALADLFGEFAHVSAEAQGRII